LTSGLARLGFRSIVPGPESHRIDRRGCAASEDAYYAALFALSDGRVGLRATVDPEDASAEPGAYERRIFGPGEDYATELLRIVDPGWWRWRRPGRPAPAIERAASSQSLDMGHAHLETRLSLVGDGRRDRLAFAVAIVPLGGASLVLREWVWEAEDAEARLGFGCRWFPRPGGAPVLRPGERPAAWLDGLDRSLAAVQHLEVLEGGDMGPLDTGAEIGFEGPAAVRGRLLHWTVLASAETGPEALDRAQAGLAEALSAGAGGLLEGHRRGWSARWSRALDLGGDAAAREGLRFGQFHLAQSADRSARRAMIGPRGLTDRRYGGLCFFNTDLFLTPYFALAEPPVAEALAGYRIDTARAARRHARAAGWPGLLVPLVADLEGRSVDALDDRRRRIGETSCHMTASALYGLARYRAATGRWPRPNREVARYLSGSRRFLRALVRSDRPVTGFDEYHPCVRRHSATLAMARWGLAWIASGALDLYPPGIDSGLERDVDGALAEFEGYFQLPDRTLARAEGSLAPLAGEGVEPGGDRLIKQADVVLMMAALPHCFERSAMAASLDYYEPRTAHASSLSPAAHGAVAAHLGRSDPAWAWIRSALRYNLDFTPRAGYRNGVHLAAYAAAILSLLEGYLGLRLAGDGRSAGFDAALPAALDSLSGTLCLSGRDIRFRVDHKSLEIDPVSVTNVVRASAMQSFVDLRS
jgi:kojibiose phosphorylase